jgi:hypothetical protein
LDTLPFRLGHLEDLAEPLLHLAELIGAVYIEGELVGAVIIRLLHKLKVFIQVLEHIEGLIGMAR